MNAPMKEGSNREKQKPGQNRSMCPVFGRCGGCQLLGMSYEEQLAWKKEELKKLLKGLCPVEGILGMKDPFHYRNKVHAVFDRDRKGNIISGIYQESTHKVVHVEQCLIEDEKADEIIGTVRGLLKSFKIRVYDEDTQFGLMRHVLVRRAFATGEIMVVLVTASPVFPSKNNFVKALREAHPEITTVVQNIMEGEPVWFWETRNMCSMERGTLKMCSAAAGSAFLPNPFTRSIPSRRRCFTGRLWSMPG